MEDRPLHSYFGVIMGMCTVCAIAILLSIWNTSNNFEDRGRIAKLITLLETKDTANYIVDEEISRLQSELKQRDFQQEFILHQVGIQSDWIVVYVTTLFILVTIIGFLNFKTRIESIEETYKQKQKSNDEHFKKLKDELKLSEIDNLDAFVNIAQFQALYYRDKNRMLDSLGVYVNGLKKIFEIKALTDGNTEGWDYIASGFLVGFSTTIDEFIENLDQSFEIGHYFMSYIADNHIKYFKSIYSSVGDNDRAVIEKIFVKMEKGKMRLNEIAAEHFKASEPKKGKSNKQKPKS